jgi:hypothetical protein
MTNLQYEDSGYRKKQEQKEKDDFAIGFAEWVTKNRNNYDYMIRTDIDGAYMSRTTKELLEIYKTEKNL